MKIREPRWSDKKEIDRIYREYYIKNEYPDFLGDKHFKCTFVITDDNDKIIVAGGIKTIAEAVFVTDKELSPRVRLDALLQGLGSSIFIAEGMKYKQIHAFVNSDPTYVKVLQRHGFRLIEDKLLVLDFGEDNG